MCKNCWKMMMFLLRRCGKASGDSGLSLANPKPHPQSWMRADTPPSQCTSLDAGQAGKGGWQQLHAHTHTHRHTHKPTHLSPSTESTVQWGQFHLWFFKEFGWYWFGAKVSSSFRQSGAFRSSWKELRPQPKTEGETLSSNTLHCILCCC